jgi:UDP-N-acetylmuramoyl-L-alanyl-D-glutamate--2,6-diaminopimelate ligase
MLLHTLLGQFQAAPSLTELPNVEVAAIREDSRLVGPGDLFVARTGGAADGREFVADAKARGAVAVVCQAPIRNCQLPQVIVPDAAAAVSILANLLRESPSHSLRVLGVTGTNGKTTTTYLIRHLLNKVGARCGMIGTVQTDDGQTQADASMTTPAACDIADLLAAMRDRGCRAAAIEVSSHSLDQKRAEGVRFAGAAFTNLTGDHLNYHKTMDNYADAKARLFAGLDAEAVAVINEASEWSQRMVRDCRARVARFGFGRRADYRAADVAATASGTNYILHTPDGSAEVHTPLIGRHNVENALAAAALVGETMGLSVHQIASGLKDAMGAPGRLQPVAAGQAFMVLVDYAHTDDALQNVLKAVRRFTRGRLRVVFGCGGGRDVSKRPRMAKVANDLADHIYITSDNPRLEDPQAILDQIVAGLPDDTDKLVCVEVDRRRAIEQALDDAAGGDVVLIAGKGHETHQTIGTVNHHFDDVEEAMRVLRRRVSMERQAAVVQNA